MVPGVQGAKRFAVIHPVSASSGSYTSVEVDTVGYDYMDVIFSNGAIAADMTVLKLQSSDVSGSGFADVTGLAFSGAGIPTTASDANTSRRFGVSLKGQKRYWKIVATVAGATVASASAFLWQGEEWPNTDAEGGYASSLTIPA